MPEATREYDMPLPSPSAAGSRPSRPAPPPFVPALTRGGWPQAAALPQTMLLVEDSRLAAEAVRLVCRRLGIRLRRADSLEMAQAHLRVYRPDVVLIDPGLPDGSGLSLIKALVGAGPRPVRIIGFSGDPAMDAPCRNAGADAFIAKPLQPARHLQALLGAQPGAFAQGESNTPAACALALDRRGENGRRTGPAQGACSGPVAAPGAGPAAGADAGAGGRPDIDSLDRALPCPTGGWSRNQGADPLALQDDLRRARALLCGAGSPGRIGFAARFLGGIARCAGDAGLMRAAERALASGNPAPLLAALDGRMRNNLDCI